MQRKWQRSWRKKLLLPIMAVSILLMPMHGVYANPTGGQITSGVGTIAQSGNTMIVTQNSNKMSINWQCFDIAQGEKVTFQQPGSSSVALNRVVGNNASAIYGQISANGQVFLINPNGILFAPGAQVNVGGLIASTQNLPDSDFQNSKYNFNSSGEGSVINRGTITASDGGYVALLGSQVSNQGVITARQGTVALGAGKATTLDFNGDGLLSLAVSQPAVQALAENKNLIQADGGQVIMTARAADALAGTVVNNNGVIRAKSINNINGVITLDGGASGTVNISGVLDASGKAAGQTGGVIKVLGNNIVTTGAAIDASGDSGGGTVSIGGDRQGKSAYQNAAIITIDTATVIHANAVTSGNGGNVTVWSEGTTNFAGTITASGGSSKGNGGNIETSGHFLHIADTANVATTSVNGKIGNWLLDPADFTIAANSGDMTGATLSSELAKTNITIQSDNGIVNTNGRGNIYVDDVVTWSANTGLTLLATNNIYINSSITATGNTAGLVMAPGSGGGYTLGSGAVITLSGSNPSLSIAGNTYTVINSVTALQNVSKGGYYALGSNIDAYATGMWNGGVGFLPIANGSPFNGTFDGLGHTISGLTINHSAQYIGLFGETLSGALIQNLGLVNCNIIGTYPDFGKIGGLVGSNGGSITNCYSTGSVTNSGNGQDYVNIGGLVGYNGGKIVNSYSSAAVTDGSIGPSSYSENGIGGVAGWNTGTILNCYSTGAMTGNSAKGGNNIGGVVGWSDGTVSNCYSAGAVSSKHTDSDLIGGVVGYYSNGTIANCYWNADNNPSLSAAGKGSPIDIKDDVSHPTGLRGTSLYRAYGYSGFDFTDTWVIYDGFSYPLLKSFLTPLTVTVNSVDASYSGATYNGTTVRYSTTPNSTLLGSLTYTYTANGKTVSPSNVGTYNVFASGLYSTSQQGYYISYVSGTLTITPQSESMSGAIADAYATAKSNFPVIHSVSQIADKGLITDSAVVNLTREGQAGDKIVTGDLGTAIISKAKDESSTDSKVASQKGSASSEQSSQKSTAQGNPGSTAGGTKQRESLPESFKHNEGASEQRAFFPSIPITAGGALSPDYESMPGGGVPDIKIRENTPTPSGNSLVVETRNDGQSQNSPAGNTDKVYTSQVYTSDVYNTSTVPDDPYQQSSTKDNQQSGDTASMFMTDFDSEQGAANSVAETLLILFL